MENSQVDLNLKGLKDELAENPAATHALLRRPDGVLVDVPLTGADLTIKNHPAWVFEGVAVPKIELATVRGQQQAQEELPLLPPKPSEENLQINPHPQATFPTPLLPPKPSKSMQKRVKSMQNENPDQDTAMMVNKDLKETAQKIVNKVIKPKSKAIPKTKKSK